ncbi:hypothetical protein [Polystyrenella longa]|uniref:hypothetical protein n=1 Tax=Polystyrenella longa TaxID=2528007 RepID=UPI0018D24C97|nr:hypothetical protein [Polystyrenella longa]
MLNPCVLGAAEADTTIPLTINIRPKQNEYRMKGTLPLFEKDENINQVFLSSDREVNAERQGCRENSVKSNSVKSNPVKSNPEKSNAEKSNADTNGA